MVFEKLDRIIELEVELETLGALAIQAGREVGLTAVEQPVIKIGGQPVIPGSSLKGAVRSILESLFSKQGKNVCIPEAAIPKERMRDKETYAKEIGRSTPCDPAKRPICPICEIFGSVSVAGRASFLDARPVGEVRMLDRTHVAITRDSKAAAGGKLMKVQAVDAGTVFRGKIRLVNPDDWQVGAIIVGVDDLNLLGMGSKKTAGYGEIKAKTLGLKSKKMVDSEWIDEPEVQLDGFKEAFQNFLRGEEE